MSLKQIILLAAVLTVASAQFRPFTFFGRRPSPPRFAPRPTFSRPPPPQQFRPAPQPQAFRNSAPSAPAQSSSSSGGSTVNFQGKSYWLSWREGRNDYSWHAARSECGRRNGKMASLSDRSVNSFLLDLLKRDDAPYFWAGAQIRGGSLIWEDGKREGISRGQLPWSHIRGGQPETDGECLAVLNNFYGDGVKWHDVSCDHGKPTVCEV